MRTHHRPAIRSWAWMIVLVAIVTSASVLALQPPDVDGIDQLMRRSHARGIFNGNVLVARQNHIVFEQAFGSADVTLKVPLTLDHRFNIGSITKEFSAVAIMMLLEEGRLTITDTVAAHLPELPSWAARVSIRDLLDYTSGIPDINWGHGQERQRRARGSDAPVGARVRTWQCVQLQQQQCLTAAVHRRAHHGHDVQSVRRGKDVSPVRHDLVDTESVSGRTQDRQVIQQLLSPGSDGRAHHWPAAAAKPAWDSN